MSSTSSSPSLWNCELVFSATDAVKMQRHSIVSDWERVMMDIFFQSVCGAKKISKGLCNASLARLAMPVLLSGIGLF